MNLDSDVKLDELISTKDDLSGADIKAMCTEAGLIALRERRMKINKDDFEKAKEKVLYLKKGDVPESLYIWSSCNWIAYISVIAAGTPWRDPISKDKTIRHIFGGGAENAITIVHGSAADIYSRVFDGCRHHTFLAAEYEIKYWLGVWSRLLSQVFLRSLPLRIGGWSTLQRWFPVLRISRIFPLTKQTFFSK